MRPIAPAAVGLVVLLVVVGTIIVAPSSAAPVIGAGAASSPATPVDPPAVAPTSPNVAEVEVAPGFTASEGWPLLGSANSTGPMDVTVGLEPRDPSGLSDYLAELYTPGSPNYHHYLDPGQLAARYGAAPATISSALAYFEAVGVDASVSPDGLLLDLTGTPAQLGTAFHTSFDRYRTGPTTWVVSHPTPAELPASIPWSGALGLGNASPVHPAVSSPLASTEVAGPDASCPTGAPYVPCQVWGAYDLADLISNGTDGAGLTIGVVDTYDGQEPESQLATDLASFDESNALPAPLLDFLYPVPTTTDLNATSNGWAYEEALDLQWAHATAPGAAIDMTFSPNSGAGLYEAIDFLVAHDLVNVISLSWGEPDVGIYNAFQGPCSAGCNASTDGSYDILSPVLEFAAAEGISVFAATGDCGAADGTSGVATNYPASDPYVTAVGGTDLSVSETGEWADETGWSGNATGATGPGCYNQGGSGGGYSPLPRPSWQSGPGLTDGSYRATPDVSAISAPGVFVVEDSQSVPLEGTSVATPIWAGIAAIADQAARTPLGFLDPSLYALLRGGGYTTDFHDIRVGNNGYAAGVGWDAVTGIGSPVVGPLVAALARSPASASTLSVDLNASVTSGPSPLEVTFFENASGGSGLYPVEGVYFGDGTAAATGTGEIAHVYSSPGVYSAQAYTWDSAGNISDSLPLAVVVGGGASLSVGLNVSNSTPASGQSVTFDANATGGVGPYVYDYWFGDGTFLNGSSSPVVSHTYAERGGYCAVAIAADSASPPNGGESIPLAVTVGGAPAPSCTVDRGARTLTPTPGLGPRDAPADVPALFRITGGVGSFSEQLVSSDPYVAACECAIFRAPGTYPVTAFVNASGASTLSATTTVVVAAPLRAVYVVGPTSGVAPLTVHFQAEVTGGYGVNTTSWNATNGFRAAGPTGTFYFATPGVFWIVAHTEDLGDGNASEAILVDVLATTGPSLGATVEPAVDVPSGSTVDLSADTANASSPVGFGWQLGSGSTAYSADTERTVYAPAAGARSFNLSGDLEATLASGVVLEAPFALQPFFAVDPDGFVPSADALVLTDVPGPVGGAPPLEWTGNATVAGPGSLAVAWQFGDGRTANGPTATTTYTTVGRFDVTLEANDSFGDTAWDVHGVAVTTAPMQLFASATPDGGHAPLVVAFRASATGGGPPYSYAWSFGGDAPVAGAIANRTYATTGEYRATVVVTDVYGQQTNRTVFVNVSAPTGIGPWPLESVPLADAVLGAGIATALVLAVIAGRRRGPPTP